MPRQPTSPDLYDAEPDYGQGVIGVLGRLISTHPSLAGGTVAFSVIFGFVAANALWSQPGQHPAPILKTREVAAPTAPAASALPKTTAPFIKDVPARTVTTFRIERGDDTATASIPIPNATPTQVPVPTPKTAAEPAVKADPVLIRIQQVLAAKGLYTGEIDGLMGPKSEAAIRTWEKANGYTQTGKATAGLLAVMDTAAQAPAEQVPPVEMVNLDHAPTPKPKPRMEPVVAADDRAGEPVTEPAPLSDVVAAEIVSELVLQIQSGLSNIAYADIAVDGVAGSQTKAAISAFEKHYRLPVTGEPNQTVLKKLIEIGAL